MKKFLALSLSLALMLALLAGCNTGKGNGNNGAQSNLEENNSILDGYPDGVIQFIVNRGAGGGTDSVARATAAAVEEKLGQPVVVMNVDGGDGLIGANEALNADPDGYTFMVVGSTEIPNLLVNGQGVKFTEEDVKAVCQLAGKSNVLMLKKDSQFSSLEELVEYGKENPGRITIGVAGGNNAYIGQQMADALGFEATIVNCNNGNELYAQILGGHIECAGIGVQFYENAIEEGLTVLADTENRDYDIEGAAPTFIQQGYDLVIETFTYICAPKDTPDEICDYISAVVGDAMESGLKDNLDEIGQGGKYMPISDFATYLEEYNERMIATYKAQGDNE